MIFVDLEKIYKNRDVPNKYILTQIVSARARQMSEQKGRALSEDSNEKFITLAMQELMEGRISFRFADPGVAVPTPKRTHVALEE
jgi:DNA-directed RNA polymerase subunit K/omega